MSNERQSSWVLRIGSLSLALGFLGFLMFRASVGCTKPDAPINPEGPPKSAAPATTPAQQAAPASPPPAPAAESAAAPAPPPASAAAPAKPAAPPTGYFPGTKAAPMPWAQEKNPPPQQQAAPTK